MISAVCFVSPFPTFPFCASDPNQAPRLVTLTPKHLREMEIPSCSPPNFLISASILRPSDNPLSPAVAGAESLDPLRHILLPKQKVVCGSVQPISVVSDSVAFSGSSDSLISSSQWTKVDLLRFWEAHWRSSRSCGRQRVTIRIRL